MNSLFLKIIQNLLRRTGRNYEISSDLPSRLLFGEVFRRGTQLCRGLLRLRTPAFLGADVTFFGRDRLNISPGVSIGSGSIIDARGRMGIVMSEGSRLGRRGIITTTSHLSVLGEGLKLGSGSGIGDFFHIGCSGGVHFGKDVIAGPYLTVHSQSHNYSDPETPIKQQGTTEVPVRVADNCWLGSRVTLLAGTELGPRTIVAAGAVVSGKHGGNEILAGIPAKSIKKI